MTKLVKTERLSDNRCFQEFRELSYLSCLPVQQFCEIFHQEFRFFSPPSSNLNGQKDILMQETILKFSFALNIAFFVV